MAGKTGSLLDRITSIFLQSQKSMLFDIKALGKICKKLNPSKEAIME
jgi:hypothetical protein